MDRITPTAGKELIARTRPFATQDVTRSWWHVASTLGALVAAIAVAVAAPWWPLRVVGGLVEALVLVRSFILYHDFMHGALLPASPVTRMLFHIQGVLLLTPARIWNDTHNHHHANTARLSASSAGTFATWTTDMWRAASTRQRLAYVVERHPLTLLFGYITAFLLSLCLVSFVRDPRRYWTSGLAVLVHIALSVLVWVAFGPAVYFFAFLGPLFVGYALGAYLFYAQHNFPEIEISSEDEWTHAGSALDASSYLECGPVLAWFTGNIGYHHIHHLNPRIPFYRLPEAMAALPELQHPRVTTLHPRDVLACLRQNLWEPKLQRMVAYRDARAGM
ncbi:fatty acid desaturase [Vitiosangium sp. GDMCC 1.1324]|uniref:fatty acid desaturase family protein n=1 Tax=Vitiosangium sp. (strain GDMCC 1.1324) TaxID=2138576 RepID=UPI000D3CA1FC|nr:fatty acid desaturase [Vitiosangium sp. GDMCC 1.1324]PTL81752.1 fatty acid desaturase [Vitiosangium sp. GDMCC 1.1324]